jgi:hypothetical protein
MHGAWGPWHRWYHGSPCGWACDGRLRKSRNMGTFPEPSNQGGCYKNGGGGGRMGRGKGDGVGAKHVLAGTLVPDAFISFGLFNILLPYQVVNTYING